jgi:DDE superfamily endonuclease
MLKTHGKEAPVQTVPRTPRRRKIDRRRRRFERKSHQRRTRNRRRPIRLAALPERLRRQVGNLLDLSTGVFTRPTGQRFVILLFAAILTTGNRTILNLLRTADALAGGHASSYHRVFSHRCWSTAALARAWARYVLKRWLPTGPVRVAGDDTVFEHRGKKVYGKGRHRDAVRSSHSYTAYRYGHKWVVLAILIRVPWSNRPWALPVLWALYRTPDWNQQHGQPHKTPAQLMRQLLAVLLHWFPERRFQFVGDGNFGTHDLTTFAHRHRRRLALVSRFYPDANLYDLPAARTIRKKGRPPVKGRKLPTPEQVVERTKRLKNRNVAWYGGGRRDIATATGTAHWYRAGDGLTPVRWVYVKDRTGTHRDEYFFTSDPDLTPSQIVEIYTARWNIETTFQETRASLKVDKTRGWTEKTVLRTTPCWMGLYGAVAAIYADLPAKWRVPPANAAVNVTFADALASVRRWLWREWFFANPTHRDAFDKIPDRLRETLLHSLAPAA